MTGCYIRLRMSLPSTWCSKQRCLLYFKEDDLMKTVVFFLLVLVGIIVSIQSGEAVVTTSPSSTPIPRGISSARTIIYNLASPDGCRQVFSTGGQFFGPGNIVVGAVNIYLSGSLTGQAIPTRGNISETFVIPPSVIKRAE